MKIIVDPMPYYPSDCLFIKLNGYDSKCPFDGNECDPNNCQYLKQQEVIREIQSLNDIVGC